MSLPEKKESPSSSLSQKGADLAVVNMILGIVLWAAIETVWFILTISGENRIFSGIDLGSFLWEPFLSLIAAGILVSLIPTLVGAKALSIWLQHNNATRKSAMIAGALIGIATISLLIVPISAFAALAGFGGIPLAHSMTLPFVMFDLPIAICAALAGGITGFQLAKFIETQNTPSPAQTPS